VLARLDAYAGEPAVAAPAGLLSPRDIEDFDVAGEILEDAHDSLAGRGLGQRWLRYLRHGYKWISARAIT
jgi:hypothetical protein